MELKRVYYSSYIPVNPQIKMTDMFHAPLLREHRLYQADWLLRFYNYKAEEILDSRNPFLDMEFDPKMAWAFRHMEFFPVEVNTADYESLLRVPGMGVRSVIKIVQARRMRPLSTDDLGKLGVVLKRAKYFITARGRLVSSFSFQVEHIKNKLRQTDKNDEQPLLFDTSQFSKKTAIIAGEP